MQLKESKKQKRRKLERMVSNTCHAPPKFSFVFYIPPRDALSGPELSSSTLSPPRSETPTESLLLGGDLSTEHTASPRDDGSSTEHAASPQDGDKTPTQWSFGTQLPPLPSEILDLDESIHPNSHPVDDDYRRIFLEGIKNISTFALRPCPLVSAIAPIRFWCSEYPGQGQGLSQASTPQCTPETH